MDFEKYGWIIIQILLIWISIILAIISVTAELKHTNFLLENVLKTQNEIKNQMEK